MKTSFRYIWIKVKNKGELDSGNNLDNNID